MLLAANANPLMTNRQGYGAHSLALFNQHEQQAQLIVKAGLERAITTGDINGIGRMLADGGPPNLQTENGATALIVAANAGDAEVVAMLLRAKADADLAESDGWTPLMFAAAGNHAQVVQALLDHGAALNPVTVQGFTALTIARDFGRSDALAVLTAYTAAAENTRVGAEARARAGAMLAEAETKMRYAAAAKAYEAKRAPVSAEGSIKSPAEADPAEKSSGWRFW